jgi:hypothetical protein
VEKSQDAVEVVSWDFSTINPVPFVKKKGPHTRAFTGNLAPQLFTALAANSGYPGQMDTQAPCRRKRAAFCGNVQSC